MKHSPRAWFEKFKSILKFGYHQCQGNHTLFIKHSSHKNITTLIIYVDDITVKCDDVEEMKNQKNILAKEFEIKDWGALR